MATSTELLYTPPNRGTLKSAGLRVLDTTLKGAFGLAGYGMSMAREALSTTQALACSALEANQQVALAAAENSRESVAALRDVAQRTIESSHENQVLIAGLATTAVAALTTLFSSSSAEKAEIQKKVEREKVDQMRLYLSEFEEISSHPEQAVSIATRNVYRLKRYILRYENERKQEQQKLLEISRNNKLATAKCQISKTISSIDSEKAIATTLLLFCGSLTFISYYFADLKVATVATAVGLIAAKAISAHVRDLNSKKRWMHIYLGALDRLKADSFLTVQSAVKKQLQATPSHNDPITEKLLNGIEDKPITVRPDDENLPPELMTLLCHAEAEPSNFSQIERYSTL